ncbi:uncharacterized mitochondrial protein AtMg00860-like [Nicotiana tomentosiformis]|uniref:uncharacterized mitochondrial protein AtMg00860-like n=1 Tax=Nicotiana tomentosiformis TaxID=4098 RepID=UPI00388C8996
MVTGWRVFMDYQKLNSTTCKDHFPMPFIDQMLDRLASGCHLGYAMPRLHFNECMMSIFSDMVEDFLEVFMNDFSLVGDSFEHCLDNLRQVLKRCDETNLVLNWKKCHFMVDEGIVLSHKISKQGIKVDRAKIEIISKLPHPISVNGVWSFLGHAGFYRRFIKDFLKIAIPASKILENDAKFEFDEKCLKAFEELKERLTTTPIIVTPDWSLSFELMYDASVWLLE